MAARMQALQAALDLAREPRLAAAMRCQDLPLDILLVIRIAAGCRQSLAAAAHHTGRRSETIRSAAFLYLQQVLLHPDADSYRVLGVDPQASQATITEHFRWLMRWLHPDRNPGNWESVFAYRVLAAWDDVKTAERRQRYQPDRRRHDGIWRKRTPRRRTGTIRLPWIALPKAAPLPSPPPRRRLPVALGLLAAFAMLVIPGPYLPTPWEPAGGIISDAEAEMSEGATEDGDG